MNQGYTNMKHDKSGQRIQIINTELSIFIQMKSKNG